MILMQCPHVGPSKCSMISHIFFAKGQYFFQNATSSLKEKRELECWDVDKGPTCGSKTTILETPKIRVSCCQATLVNVVTIRHSCRGWPSCLHISSRFNVRGKDGEKRRRLPCKEWAMSHVREQSHSYPRSRGMR